MSDKIEVGEYVRTESGNIFKVDKNKKVLKALKFLDAQYGKITKHSKNIIDLIEVGDYVNEVLIEEIQVLQGKKCLFYDLQLPIEVGLHFFVDKDIKSILTREQYEANCYEVEGE